MMDWVTSLTSQETILNMMVGECKKNGNINEDIQINMILRVGMFFE